MNFTADCVQMVERSRCWERERISVQDTPCGRVLVKGQRPRRGPFRFALLSGLARWMNSPLLRPVPQRGGAAAQATEVRRLRALSAAGVRVPAVLHESADHVVLQFLGATACTSCSAAMQRRRCRLSCAGCRPWPMCMRVASA